MEYDRIGLDVARQFLEHGRSGAATAGARGDLRRENAETHGLQDFARDLHFQRAVAAGLRGQRDADGVADALLQQHAERGRGGDDPFRAHAGFGQAEMNRVVGARGQHAIDGDEVLHPETLADRMMRSRARPISSARAADKSADCVIASRITARASSGAALVAFSSIR